MKTVNVYQNFLESLYIESPRAAWALEGMKYCLMSQTGLDEGDALEVVSKLVAADRIPGQAAELQAEVMNGRYNMHSENNQRQTMRRQSFDG